LNEVNPLDLVETIREGLLVLDPDLTVRFANRSFADTFAVTPEDTVGRKLYELGNGQWDIPELRSLIGLGGRLVDTFARQLGGQVARESGDTGTIVCLTLPSREASYDLRA
jgi:PAS domain-containing protein